MQPPPTGKEAPVHLCLVLPRDETHELGLAVAVVVRRAERGGGGVDPGTGSRIIDSSILIHSLDYNFEALDLKYKRALFIEL